MNVENIRFRARDIASAPHRIRLASFCLILLLAGCANLQEVRDFTSESAKLTSYTGVIDYTLASYSRTEPYLTEKTRLREQAEDAARKASRDDLVSLQNSASLYMATLAKLAGAGAFSVDANIDKLAISINAAPEFGIQQTTVDAYAGLLKQLAKWALSGVQEKAVKEMVREGGDDFEKVVAGMYSIVQIMRKIHVNEGKTVTNSLELLIDTTPETANNYLLLSLARDKMSEKRLYYKQTDSIYEKALKGIQDIRAGHQLMASNLDQLTSSEVRTKLKQLGDEIQSVRASLTKASI